MEAKHGFATHGRLLPPVTAATHQIQHLSSGSLGVHDVMGPDVNQSVGRDIRSSLVGQTIVTKHARRIRHGSFLTAQLRKVCKSFVKPTGGIGPSMDPVGKKTTQEATHDEADFTFYRTGWSGRFTVLRRRSVQSLVWIATVQQSDSISSAVASWCETVARTNDEALRTKHFGSRRRQEGSGETKAKVSIRHAALSSSWHQAASSSPSIRSD